MFSLGSSASCTCEWEQALTALRDARVIVEGKIHSAQRREGGVIAFTLVVERVLRGEVTESLPLTTWAPEDCGLSVRLAYGDVYFFSDAATPLHACQSLRPIQAREEARAYALAQVLQLVASPSPAGDEALKGRLTRTLRGLDAAQLHGFFQTVARIDPIHQLQSDRSDALIYRDLRVRLAPDGTYLALEPAAP